MRLLCLNVERSAHLHRFIPFIRRYAPDVACLQELVESDIAAIQNATGLGHCHFVAMGRSMPDDPAPFGVGILARTPFAFSDTLSYAGAGDGLTAIDRTSEESRINSLRYSVARAALVLPDFEVTIATTHFPWSDLGQARPFQFSAAKRMIEMLGEDAFALCGDFNAPRGGPIFDLLAQAWRDCIPADVETSIDPQLHRAGPLQRMVDGLFVSGNFVVRDVRLHSGLSDHQAITAEVSTFKP